MRNERLGSLGNLGNLGNLGINLKLPLSVSPITPITPITPIAPICPTASGSCPLLPKPTNGRARNICLGSAEE